MVISTPPAVARGTHGPSGTGCDGAVATATTVCVCILKLSVPAATANGVPPLHPVKVNGLVHEKMNGSPDVPVPLFKLQPAKGGDPTSVHPLSAPMAMPTGPTSWVVQMYCALTVPVWPEDDVVNVVFEVFVAAPDVSGGSALASHTSASMQ